MCAENGWLCLFSNNPGFTVCALEKCHIFIALRNMCIEDKAEGVYGIVRCEDEKWTKPTLQWTETKRPNEVFEVGGVLEANKTASASRSVRRSRNTGSQLGDCGNPMESSRNSFSKWTKMHQVLKCWGRTPHSIPSPRRHFLSLVMFLRIANVDFSYR